MADLFRPATMARVLKRSDLHIRYMSLWAIFICPNTAQHQSEPYCIPLILLQSVLTSHLFGFFSQDYAIECESRQTDKLVKLGH